MVLRRIAELFNEKPWEYGQINMAMVSLPLTEPSVRNPSAEILKLLLSILYSLLMIIVLLFT
jgi:hypothetical protein